MLNHYRQQIDETDQAILDLLKKRQNIVKQIGLYKHKRGIKVLQTNRFNVLLMKLTNKAKELNMDAEYVRELYEVIHKYSIKIQKK